MSVAPRPIKCGGLRPDGSECQEFAAVTNARYVYDREPLIGGDSDFILREIHYDALCPVCGERTIVEK